jgi:hypothetical protein
MRLEELGQLKNLATSSIIEAAIVRLVAQCLNQLGYRVPRPYTSTVAKRVISYFTDTRPLSIVSLGTNQKVCVCGIFKVGYSTIWKCVRKRPQKKKVIVRNRNREVGVNEGGTARVVLIIL